MSNSSGQSLFEVVIALAISTIIIVTLVALVSNSIRNSTFSRNKTLASRFAQEATEWLRGQRDLDIEVFRTNTQIATWCFTELNWGATQIGVCSSGDEIAGTSFRRQADFNTTQIDCSPTCKTVIEANIKVSWTDSQGDHEVTSATSFSDWRER